MAAEQCQTPAILKHMPSVDWSGPNELDDTSRQASGPVRRSKSTSTSPRLKFTLVIFAVWRQPATPGGLLWKTALNGSNGSTVNDCELVKALASPLLSSRACAR